MTTVHSSFIARIALLICLSLTAKAATIEPGQLWLDTDGRAINAHGGGVLFYAGVYYWYGEVKEGRTYLPKANQAWGGTRVLAGGVSCYSSVDLHSWKNCGVVLPTVVDDPDSDLFCENVIERPKVVYNAATKKFVLWFHQDSPDYAAARCGVAVADSPTGRFAYLGSFRPNGNRRVTSYRTGQQTPPAKATSSDSDEPMARDMTLFVDDDGRGYVFYASEQNQTMHVSALSSDYLRTEGPYSRILVGRAVEAPAVFKRAGKYYLLGSGCTGWEPNAARLATAEHILGPWTEWSNPCRGERAEQTFGCQSAWVIPVLGKPDLLIAMFDRWNKWDLAASRYVWLPIAFDTQGRPTIPWKDQWTLPALP